MLAHFHSLSRAAKISRGNEEEQPLAHATSHSYRSLSHPLHITLLVSALPLFLGALLSDWAYSVSYEAQWINFASWLIAGALVFLAAALVWTFVQALSPSAPHGRTAWILFALLMVTFVVGFINALVHAKDAGATMPDGLILSVIVLIMVVLSVGYGFGAPRSGEQA